MTLSYSMQEEECPMNKHEKPDFFSQLFNTWMMVDSSYLQERKSGDKYTRHSGLFADSAVGESSRRKADR